jgi:phosphoglycerate dehydrogenase-like enzyme
LDVFESEPAPEMAILMNHKISLTPHMLQLEKLKIELALN